MARSSFSWVGPFVGGWCARVESLLRARLTGSSAEGSVVWVWSLYTLDPIRVNLEKALSFIQKLWLRWIYRPYLGTEIPNSAHTLSQGSLAPAWYLVKQRLHKDLRGYAGSRYRFRRSLVQCLLVLGQLGGQARSQRFCLWPYLIGRGGGLAITGSLLLSVLRLIRRYFFNSLAGALAFIVGRFSRLWERALASRRLGVHKGWLRLCLGWHTSL